MPSTTSFKTVERLRTLFASYGLTEEVVSDNGTNFTSGEFRGFLSNNVTSLVTILRLGVVA